jgi:hypothetical protein
MTLTRGATWLTVTEAAQRVNRSERTILRWVQLRRVPIHLGHIEEIALLEAERAARKARNTPRGVVARQHASDIQSPQDHRSVPIQRQPSS